MSTPDPALLRLPAVAQLVGMTPPQVRARVAAGTFPRPVKIGARAIAWRRADIEIWIAALPSADSPTKDIPV